MNPLALSRHSNFQVAAAAAAAFTQYQVFRRFHPYVIQPSFPSQLKPKDNAKNTLSTSQDFVGKVTETPSNFKRS